MAGRPQGLSSMTWCRTAGRCAWACVGWESEALRLARPCSLSAGPHRSSSSGASLAGREPPARAGRDRAGRCRTNQGLTVATCRS